MTRLLGGRPIHTTPELLKENLYKEAQVSRATMNRHREILDRWDEAVRQKLAGPAQEGLAVCIHHDKQIADLSTALSAARQQLSEAKERVQAAATVISALHAENTHLQHELGAKRKATVTDLSSHGTAGLR